MSQSNNPQQQFLEELAGALKASKFKCLVKNDHGGLRIVGATEEGLTFAWSGYDEHPSLAFAMLDVLERSKIHVTFHQSDLGGCYGISLRPPESKLIYQQSDSRTKTIGLALIKASQAGLTKYEKEQNQ